MITKPTLSPKDQFVAFAGEIAEMLAFNRSIGQLYGLLYISSEPMCLEDIAKACRMSKGNASVHLRTLENWGAVHGSGKTGTRKDYYTANPDLRSVAFRRLQEGLSRRLDHARQKLAEFKSDPRFSGNSQRPEDAHFRKRLNEIESLIQQIQAGIALAPKLLGLKRFL
jgi:DNA-binding transcriptional regulator GbsR (MarR family)